MKTRSNPDAVDQFRIGMGLTRFALRSALRNRAGYFFSFIFPLVFVIAFGMIGPGSQKVRLGVVESLPAGNPVAARLRAMAAEPSAPVDLVTGSLDRLQQRLQHGEIAGIVAGMGADGRVELLTSPASPSGGAAMGLLNAVLDDMSLKAAGVTHPAFSLAPHELPGRASRYFDFALPGQIGFSLLSLATFGIGFGMQMLRKTLVLKRLAATAVRPLTFVVAQGLSRSVQAVLQTALLIAIGVFAFHFTLARGWISAVEMLLLAFVGIVGFLGFGILFSNIFQDEHTLPVAMNLFNLPQMLLSGVFFPIELLPRWLQPIGGNLPLAYLTTSLRKVAGEGAGIESVWPYVLGMLAWSAVAYGFAAKTYQTE